MGKYAGSVGYVTNAETKPGVWEPVSTERLMQGDVLRAASVFQGTDRVNKNVTLQHRISLVGDAYAYDNFFNMKWVAYLGSKWEITAIEVVKPRLIITLGGVWVG